MTVLVVSSATTALPLQNGRTFRTGFWLAELALPLERILESGHAVEIATPGGMQPSPDPRSLALLLGAERARQLAVLSRVEGVRQPLRLDKIFGYFELCIKVAIAEF
jgi:putative intracellular protease/amidase